MVKLDQPDLITHPSRAAGLERIRSNHQREISNGQSKAIADLTVTIHTLINVKSVQGAEPFFQILEELLALRRQIGTADFSAPQASSQSFHFKTQLGDLSGRLSDLLTTHCLLQEPETSCEGD